MQTQDEWVQSVISALEKINPDDSAAENLASYLYVADPRMSGHLDELRSCLADLSSNSISKHRKQIIRLKSGKILERISYLAFRGLRGATVFKSFQSAGPQYDLIVSGDNEGWMAVCKVFYMSFSERDILIEAKARNSKVDDQQFARLCSLMEINLRQQSGLGIFFSLAGATGFPEKETRQRSLRDAKLRQVLFTEKTGKRIIVLSKKDIFSLGENASLTKIIVRKIRDIGENAGLETLPVSVEEIDLPAHLQELHDISDSVN
jgi:hypothetical protein